MDNPYQSLPAKAFWRSAVASRNALEISDLWDPKRDILRNDKIATMGSCFAQHIGRALAARDYSWFDAESAPSSLSHDEARNRNYGIFSARTGNVYTAAALRQWVDWALGTETPPEEVWERDGRYFDPFRPAIEPSGFSSPAELFASREVTLRAVRDIVARTRYLVFTMGLTEGWINKAAGYVYAMCPGTTAGAFDDTQHAFKNYNFGEVLSDMQRTIDAVAAVNQDVSFILTVSPVPLTATASGKHVLTATTQSKAVLRAVAGELAETRSSVDYFPSYEIITGIPFRSAFYEPNLRSVTTQGVQFVMDSFFACLSEKFAPRPSYMAIAPVRGRDEAFASAAQTDPETGEQDEDEDDVVCEEEMLAAFAPLPATAAMVANKDAAAAKQNGVTKLCVIGNSHMAALKVAVRDGLFQDAGIDLTFWGFPGHGFEKIKWEDGLFIPPDEAFALRVSDGKYRQLRPADFDALLFVGAAFNTTQMLYGWRRKVSDIREYPRELFHGTVRRRIERTFLVDLMAAARRFSHAKTLFTPTALISEVAGRRRDLQIRPEELTYFNGVLRDIFGEMGIVYLPQPAETIKDNKWTKSEYSVEAIAAIGGRKRPGRRSAAEHRHMNAKYGALVLAAARDELLGNGRVGRPRLA